ncbi:MAG TPA: hypothetical protein ENH85_12320 [Candidatus Scalindua sp.]|nr:hypothetical protein [Candidatus Scalindua sp.]
MSKLFTELWSRINNPRSACPDIETGHVRQLMADILAEHDQSDLSYEEKWIRALVMIAPTRMSSIEFYWEYKSVGHDYEDFDELDRRTAEAKRIAKEAVKSLVDKDEIILIGDKYNSTIHTYQER